MSKLKTIKRKIILNGRVIEYELTRKNVKNINLRVRSDASVCVSANSKVEIETIENFISSYSDNIINAIDKYNVKKAESNELKSIKENSQIKIFGEYKSVCLEESSRNSVVIDGSKIILSVTDINDDELKLKTLEKYMHAICKEVIIEFCNEIYPHFEKILNYKFPTIKFRTMKTRWGSCNTKDKILTFNYLLIGAPKDSIYYVVVHEFCHFIHPNHSKEFHNSVSSFLPNWKELKKNLEK